MEDQSQVPKVQNKPSEVTSQQNTASADVITAETGQSPQGVPSSVSSTPTPPKKKSNKLLILVSVIVIVVLIGLATFYITRHTNSPSFTTSSSPSSSSISVGSITVKYIDMPGLSDYKAGNINGVDESQGHYVYGDAKVECAQCAQPYWGKGKVVYDGKTAYSGEVDSASVKLSTNGQHYSYAVPSSSANNESFYIDNRYLSNSNKFIVGSSVAAISDNGIDYAYDNESGLYVSSTLKYSPPVAYQSNISIDSPMLSSDLSDYITGVLTGADSTDGGIELVVYNGKVLTSSGESGDMQMSISNNGQHYIYATNGIVDHDGTTIAANKSYTVSQVAVDDSGDYSYTTCNSTTNASTVFIGNQSYMNGTCGSDSGNPVPVALSNSSHYFYFNNDQPSDKAVLDGKQLTLSGEISGADFSGNTLYVYRWVN